jgi:amidase
MSTTSHQFDPDFGSALDAAAAIREKKISSVELTQHMFRRMDAFEPALNAYVYQLREEALAAAKRADDALGNHSPLGAFHGVPINVKESYAVSGQPCTWGIPEFRNIKAPAHAVAVRRLLDAGSILLGATNVPQFLMDTQTFNEIYGRTNNPWDLERTPGGSSGGSAASLAAGTTFFSLGSDVGGSIRTPAAFCGVYGHKPTLDIVNQRGHQPGGIVGAPGFSTLLAVSGPMARYAEDLEASLNILAGTEYPDSKAFQWTLPHARHEKLSEFRIGFVLEDPSVPVSVETKSVLDSAIRACEKTGAIVREGWPEGFRLGEMFETYLFLLGALDFSLMPPQRQRLVRPEIEARSDAMAEGSLATFAEWQLRNIKRLACRAAWERFFQSVDVFLLPTNFTAAFRHDPSPIATRTIPMPEGGAQPFVNMLAYIVPATLTGCPATTAPAGLSNSGLPVGIQIMGPYLEDATPIRFAQLLASEIGGFQPPKGYATP